jgi:hypothetical protein
MAISPNDRGVSATTFRGHEQGRWNVIRLTTAAVMMTWMAAEGSRLAAQDLRVDPSDAAAIRVSVETLAQHVGQFAGLRVRVADAIVERVVSPRVFVLTGQRPVVGLNGRDYVGVVVGNGTASVVANMPVVVTGAAGTFSGAEVTGVLARTEALTEPERAALRKYPLVLAMTVETQGSVNLLRDLPAAPSTPAQPAAPAVPR